MLQCLRWKPWQLSLSPLISGKAEVRGALLCVPASCSVSHRIHVRWIYLHVTCVVIPVSCPPIWCYLWLPPAETLDRSQKVPWVKPYVWALKDGWFGWLATNRHGRCCVIWREKFGRWPNGITWSNLKLWRTNVYISQPSGLLRKLQGKEQELAQHLHQELSEVWSWSKISGVNVLLGAFFCAPRLKRWCI